MKESAYIDITEEMFKNIKPKGKVKELSRIILNGKIYRKKNPNIIFNYSKHEKEIAQLIVDTFGGKLYLRPEFIRDLDGNRSADYIWNNENWDLKEINGNGKRTIDTAIKSMKYQSNNVILEIKNKNYTLNEILKILNKIYKDEKRTFLNKTMIIINKKIIIVKRKEETLPPTNVV